MKKQCLSVFKIVLVIGCLFITFSGIAQIKLEGVVWDSTVLIKGHKLPVRNASVILTNTITKFCQTVTTDKNGYYSFILSPDSEYVIFAGKKTYEKSFKVLITKEKIKANIVHTLDFNIAQHSYGCPVLLGYHFGFDSTELRQVDIPILETLAKLLKTYSYSTIEIRSSCDCTEHNKLKLTQMRSQSIADALITRGVEKERLILKAVGDSQLIFNCGCGNDKSSIIICREEEHQANRRTEIHFLRFDYQSPSKTIKLEGVVFDTTNSLKKIPIKNATVIVTNLENGTKAEAKTDANGKYSFDLEKEKEYTIYAFRKTFINSKSLHISAVKNAVQNIYIVQFSPGQYLGEKDNPIRVHFNFNRPEVSEASKTALDTMVNMLNVYPYTVLEIYPVYDSGLNYQRNDTLEMLRFWNIAAYFISKGIDSGRLCPPGYEEKEGFLPKPCGCDFIHRRNSSGPQRSDYETKEAGCAVFKFLRFDYEPREERKSSH